MEAQLRTDVVALLATRREARRTRRSLLSHRQPRFNNRRKSKKPGWLAPSTRQRVDAHLRLAAKACSLLPVRDIVVETAQFDMQKIKNPGIQGQE